MTKVVLAAIAVGLFCLEAKQAGETSPAATRPAPATPDANRLAGIDLGDF
jgi:hypothetical protein